MRIRSPSLPELHAFVAVVETGGFSRAAARLSVTQGAVSRALLRLEARLGVALVERSQAGCRATEAGRNYYTQVQPALATLESAVPTAAPEPRDLLRLAAIPTLNMRWLVPRLPLLHQQHPELRVMFQPYWKDDDLLRDDVDGWLMARPTATSRWPRHVRARYVIGREIVPICHPSRAASIRRPQDLLRLPLLHHGSYPGNWSHWLREQGVDVRQLRLGTGFDLAAGLIEAVLADMGVAVVQTCLIERELAEGRIAVPLPTTVSTGRGYYLCVPRAHEGAPAMQHFADWLLSQAAATAPLP